jgi:hypothetical protein
VLARKSYTAAEVETARQAMATYVDRIRALPADGAADLVPALVIVLDAQFLHRMRGQEGKAADSPLKRARTLAEQVVTGDVVDLDLAGFEALAEAFYAELETRFPPD